MGNRLISKYKKSFRFLIMSLSLSIFTYLFISILSGWNEFKHVIEQIGLSGLCIALLGSIINYYLRFLRWNLFLKNGNYVINPVANCLIYISGFALTTTPGKAGEAIRSFMLHDRFKIPYTFSFAMLINERLYDFLAIVILATFGLGLTKNYQSLIALSIVILLMIAYIIMKRGLLEKVQNYLDNSKNRVALILQNIVSILINIRQFNTPKQFCLNLIISLLAWGTEAIAFYYIVNKLNLNIGESYAVFTYAVSMLIGAISFLPGGLGTTEVVMVTLLSIINVPKAVAIAVTVFTRVVTLWFAVALGILALLKISVQTEGEHGTI